MKHLLYLIIISLLISCGSQKEMSQEERLAKKLKEMAQLEIPTSSSVQIAGDVEYLANDALEGRETGSEGIEKAAQFIEIQ